MEQWFERTWNEVEEEKPEVYTPDVCEDIEGIIYELSIYDC